MTELTAERLERKIGLARLALAWERLWAALCWPLITALAAYALASSGLLLQAPYIGRLVILGLLSALFLWTCRGLLRFSWPSRHEAMRRIESMSELGNRPVSASFDALADPVTDETSKLLWQEHKRRQWSLLARLKVGHPRSAWRDIDSRALRVPALLACLAAILLAPPAGLKDLAGSLEATPAEAAAPVTLDAWLRPPPYTGRRPLLLTSPAQIEALKANPSITAPEKSRLTLRLNGSEAPRIAFFDGSGEIKNYPAKVKSVNGSFEVDAELSKPVTIKVLDGDREMAAWPIAIIPDKPPTIAITGEPAAEASGSLTLKWKAADDYGVAKIASKIDLSDEQDDGMGFSGNGVFLFEAPELKVAMRKSQPKEEAGTTAADLTAHPWAGFMVDLTLTARDAAGQTGDSETKRIRLPERFFTKPLARAVIEQRKSLIMDTDNAGDVAKLLSAILIYPEGLIERSGVHIAMASIVSRLNNVRGPDDYLEAVQAMWDLAVSIEDGDLGNARDQLEQAKKALEDAIRNGASPEQLKQLTQKLRQAMDRYLQSLTREAQKNPQRQQDGQQGQEMRQQDLQKMLDDVEKLAQQGAKDQAQQLLSELDRILKNLQAGRSQDGQQQQGESQAGQMMNQLSEMMRKQQQLMDETQRMQQPGEGMGQQEGLNPEGDDPGNRSGNQQQGQGDLPGRQGDLQKMLEQMLSELGQNGLNAPNQLGEAGKNMGRATDSLRGQEREEALGEQGEALKNLRQGAQQLARELRQRARASRDANAREGEGRGEDHDPLGRPLPTQGEEFGPKENMLPSELAIRRAREILENLRNRANTPDLPAIDRGYIERLLRGLY
jgi:uncharacterized protein (TIGR02302 family)